MDNKVTDQSMFPMNPNLFHPNNTPAYILDSLQMSTQGTTSNSSLIGVSVVGVS